MTEHRYSQDEVNAILGRAIEREHGRGELSHDDLVSAAREVGISADAIEAAAAEVLIERSEKGELQRLRTEQWHRFFRHLVPYLLVNGMLITLNVMTSRFPWAMFAAVGWGIGLLFQFLALINPNPKRLERLLERERLREKRRDMRRRVRENASQLEHDVGAGLSALLQAAAQRIASEPANKGAAHRSRVVETSGSEIGAESAENPGRGRSRPRGGTPQS